MPLSRPKIPSSRPKIPSSRPKMTVSKQEEQSSTDSDIIKEDTGSPVVEKEAEEAKSTTTEIEEEKQTNTNEESIETVSKDSPPQISSSIPKMPLSRPSSAPKIQTSTQQEKEDVNAEPIPQEEKENLAIEERTKVFTEDPGNVEAVTETDDSLPKIPTSRPKVPISRPKPHSSASSEFKSDSSADDSNLTIATNSGLTEDANSTDAKNAAYSNLTEFNNRFNN
ncbi:unnamed protein product [[Candida] boidinii]|nr:unnamed protein product [[Candida] boidinii]